MVKVSVIIPTYGKPIYLEKAIKSVLSQTLKEIELIVVDDNDPEAEARALTETLVKQYALDDRFYYIKHPQNLNGAVARNTGISASNGRYISFLDSDDEYMPERLEKCFNKMEETDSNIAGVYTGCEFRKAGKVYSIYKDVKEGNYLVSTLACTFMFCTGSNIFARRNVVEELHGFDRNFLRHQDYEFLARLFENYSLTAIPEVLVIKNNENMNLPDVEKMINIKKQYVNKFRDVIKQLPDKEQQYIYHSQYVQLAESAIRAKRYRLADSLYKKAQRHGKLTFKEVSRRIGLVGNNLIHR